MNFANQIAAKLSIDPRGVAAVISLLDEGATVPFIARYRKERTGMLDEEQIINIKSALQVLAKLEDRRSAILASLSEQHIADSTLLDAINRADTLSILEDLYLPYKPKRKTRASIARERGLEELARQIFSQQAGQPKDWARRFINKDVPDTDAALQGACDIIAEWVSEQAELRQDLRLRFEKYGILTSSVVKTKADEAVKFSDYFKQR
jgi:uncharacterized protein